jgi:hypothetical protein
MVRNKKAIAMKEVIVKATVRVDKITGKKTILSLHFTNEVLRKITDKEFIKRVK